VKQAINYREAGKNQRTTRRYITEDRIASQDLSQFVTQHFETVTKTAIGVLIRKTVLSDCHEMNRRSAESNYHLTKTN
jgi:hypothetical protein